MITKNKLYNVAIIGATGNVGRQLLDSLWERKFPIQDIKVVASEHSVGKKISFGEKTLSVESIESINFSKIDFAFFCAGSEISKQYAKIAASKGCVVIDKSSFFRLDQDIPLIVPEVNSAQLLKVRSGIIASPNCCTIPLAVVLKPLDNAAKIKRVIVSTYQSVSGAGKQAMDELYKQTKAKFVFEQLPPEKLPYQIAFNLFPHIGNFREDRYTEEEFKIQSELLKIIGHHIKVTVTCVRVPVFVSHSMSVNVEFNHSLTAEEATELLYEEPGVIVYTPDNEIKYATPVDVVTNDEIFVSRIRDDMSQENSINLWICADNLRKGAALNSIQIAEEVIKGFE